MRAEPGDAGRVEREELVDAGHRGEDGLEALGGLDGEATDGRQEAVVAGEGHRRGEAAEVRRPEQDEVADDPASLGRAEQLERAGRRAGALGVGDQVDRARGAAGQGSEPRREQGRGDVEVLPPVDAEDLDGVATDFQGEAQDVVEEWQGAERGDPDLRVEVALPAVVRGELELAELVAEGDEGVDPDPAVAAGGGVAEALARKPGTMTT